MKNIKRFDEFNINEGLAANIIKGYIQTSQLIKNFKKLFDRIDRTELFKDIKLTGNLVDFVFFLRDSKWYYDESLDQNDIDKLSKKYNIDKKYPTLIDILKAEYNNKFKRDMKKDVDNLYDYLTDEKSIDKLYNKGDAKSISMLKQFIIIIEEFKNLLD